MAAKIRQTSELRLGPRWIYPLKAGMVHARSAAWRLRQRAHDGVGDLRIFAYHRVSDDRDELAVPVSRFRSQMELLASRGYRVVDIAEAMTLLNRPEPRARTVALSFDDGYEDNAEHALPILEEHGFSATVFVVTGFATGQAKPVWYEGGHPAFLSRDDIVSLDGKALRFEAHTLSHPNLLALDPRVARREISGSKAELEDWLNREVTVFCYPAGLYGSRERHLVAAAGFDLAASCKPGVNTVATDRLELRRIEMGPRDRLLDFRAKLAGAHDEELLMRSAYRRLRYAPAVSRP